MWNIVTKARAYQYKMAWHELAYKGIDKDGEPYIISALVPLNILIRYVRKLIIKK